MSTRVDSSCPAEVLGITLKLKDGRKIILCSYYRVGTLGVENHRVFCDYVRKVRRRRGVSGIIISGDLNLPGIDWDDFNSQNALEQSFLDSFSNFGFEQLIRCPTHKGGNILDLILTDLSTQVFDIVVTDERKPCKSDHFSMSFKIRARVKRLKTPKREVLNFKRANWALLNSALNEVDWEGELSGDIDTAWTTFKATLSCKVDNCIPKIKIGGKILPPWFDAETHQMCRKKERLHTLYKTTEDPVHKTQRYVEFSKCRKDFKNLVSRKLGESFEDDADPNLITKKFWSYVKATSNNTRIPELINLGEVFRTDHKEQAELFNIHFKGQFSDASHYNIPVNHFDPNDEWHIDFSSSRIQTILRNLNPNKAIGPDKIHGMVLKNCSQSLALPLSILFRKSYSLGTLPSEWKLAHVVPVHKKGSKADAENYRPISLTSLVVKVMERIVRDDLMARCHHLVDNRQHGFLPEKSCSTQLTQFCDSLALSLNKNIRADVVYFDFAKAFDSVNHDLILNKLKHSFGIDGRLLEFIKKYLSGRQQAVLVNGSISSTIQVLSGVPQGSILGPSLFVLFINDISVGLSPGTNIVLYADDTKIWREMVHENDYLAIQKDIDYLLDWAVQNKMKFHPSKCKVLSIAKSCPPLMDVLPCIQYFYSMGDTILDYTDSEKDLGILMNSSLNFNEQANFLYGKANQKLGMLKRNCYFVSDVNRRKVLYLTLVRSIFEHCPSIWRPGSESIVNKLESLQKRALKWIRNDYSVSYSIDELHYLHCKQLNILPIKFRFDYHDLKLLHSIVYGFSCVNLPNYLSFFSGNSRLRSSHLDHLSLVSAVIPLRRGYSNSYFYRSHLSWNRLPLSLREIVRPGAFKLELLKYIWSDLVFEPGSMSEDSFSSSHSTD